MRCGVGDVCSRCAARFRCRKPHTVNEKIRRIHVFLRPSAFRNFKANVAEAAGCCSQRCTSANAWASCRFQTSSRPPTLHVSPKKAPQALLVRRMSAIFERVWEVLELGGRACVTAIRTLSCWKSCLHESLPLNGIPMQIIVIGHRSLQIMIT